MIKSRVVAGLVAFSLYSFIAVFPAQGIGSAFTYQGHLNDGGLPASGSYDFVFTLFDSATGGAVVSGPVTNAGIAVSNAQFVTTIDFGPGVFAGSNYWLGIAVSTNGAGVFTGLTPRQAITPVPYAMVAASASNLLGTVSASQLPGTVITNNQTNVVLGGSFSGDGSQITNLISSQIPNLDWGKLTSGKPTTLAGYGITDAQPANANLANLAVLSASAAAYLSQLSSSNAANLTNLNSSNLVGIVPIANLPPGQTNLVPTGAVYDANGLYTISTTVGATYWLFIGGKGAPSHNNNDGGLSNGTARVLVNGFFTASNSITTLISSKIINGSSPGPGKPVASTVYLVTDPPIYQLTDPSMYSLARNYGITGVGDETAKLTNAFNNAGNPKVLLVDISFSITNATIPNGFTLLGDGHSTITQLTNATGDMLVSQQGSVVTYKNLILQGLAYGQTGNGGNPSYNWTAANSQVTQGASVIRNGLHVDALSGSVIDNCSIAGFSGAGLAIDGYGVSLPQPQGSTLTVNGLKGGACWQGVVCSNGGEYYILNNINLEDCGHAIEIGAGNVLVNGASCTKNGIGVYVNGDVNNPAHGLVANCILNHNAISIEAIDVPNGEIFNNIEILGANDTGGNGILLTNCFGIVFDGGYWNSTMTITNSGGGTNKITKVNSLGYPSVVNVNGGTMLNTGFFNVGGSTIETNNVTTAYTVPPIFQATNAAPANVSIGTTAPDGYFKWTNANGVLMVTPGWFTTH